MRMWLFGYKVSMMNIVLSESLAIRRKMQMLLQLFVTVRLKVKTSQNSKQFVEFVI